MILNGLGFVSSPLYMFPDFFQDKPCEHLIGILSGIKWLCRVPMTIGLAKELVSTLLSPDFISSYLPGYYYSVIKSN